MNLNLTSISDENTTESTSSIVCRQEELQIRLNKCKECINFYTDEIDQQTKCRESGYNISLMITMKDKECPLGKW